MFLEKTSRYLIIFLLTALCPLTFFHPRIAPIILSLLAIGALPSIKKNTLKQLFFTKLSLSWFFLLLFGGISGFWSLSLENSLYLFIRLGALYACALVWCSYVKDSDPSVLLKPLGIGFFIGFLMLVLNVLILNNYWLAFIQKSQAQAFVPLVLTFVIFVWPLLFYGYKLFGVKVIIGAIIVFPIPLFFIDCDTAPVAFFVGLLGGGIYMICPLFFKNTTKIVAILFSFLFPFLVDYGLDQPLIEKLNKILPVHSYVHRLYVFKNVAKKIKKKWIAGYGLNTSRHEQLAGPQTLFPLETKEGEKTFIQSKEIPTHPHNAPLQWWLELGIGGVFLACIFQYFVIQAITSRRSFLGFSQAASFSAISVIALVNLGFWQNWWISSLIISLPFLFNQSLDEGGNFNGSKENIKRTEA